MPAFSAIPAISAVTAMSAGNLRCNLGRQSPSQSQQSCWGLLAISDWKFDTLSSPANHGIFMRQSLQSRQSRPATLSIFSSSACNHPFPIGIIGNPGILGRQSRQSRKSWNYLHSRHSQQSLQSLQCRPVISIAISAVLLRTFGKHGLKIRHAEQPRQSRHCWAAVSPVPAIPSATSGIFSISACNHPFSSGNIGNPGNLRPKSGLSRQSCHYLHSRQSQQSLQSPHCRPKISVAFLAISVRKFCIVITPSKPELSAFLAIFGTLATVGHLGSLSNLGTLASLGNVGQKPPSRSRPLISVAISTILVRTFGNLAQKIRHSHQPRHSRHFWAAVSAVTLIPSGNLVNSFLSQHAITHSRPAISVILAILGDSLGNRGNLANICILCNPSNLGSLCNVGRHSSSQSGQSLSARSAFSSPPATPAISAFLGRNLCSPGNPGRQFRHFLNFSM